MLYSKRAYDLSISTYRTLSIGPSLTIRGLLNIIRLCTLPES